MQHQHRQPPVKLWAALFEGERPVSGPSLLIISILKTYEHAVNVRSVDATMSPQHPSQHDLNNFTELGTKIIGIGKSYDYNWPDLKGSWVCSAT